MSKNKGMKPAQKAAARWEPVDESEAASSVEEAKPEAVKDGKPQTRKAAISLEGLLAPVVLIAIIAVVGFILTINQGGYY